MFHRDHRVMRPWTTARLRPAPYGTQPLGRVPYGERVAGNTKGEPGLPAPGLGAGVVVVLRRRARRTGGVIA